MYHRGDLVIYSAHGICEIVDMTEMTVAEQERRYYVLQPIENKERLTIHVPVDNHQQMLQQLIDKEEAFEILESFEGKGIEWEGHANARYNTFQKIVQNGERKEIAKVINTLLRKKIELEAEEKKLHKKDERLLEQVKNILWKELSLALDMTVEEVRNLLREKIMS